MANTLILTLLPNGVDRATGTVRLSVVAGFQLGGPINRFEGSPIDTWPTLAAGLQLGVLESGTDEPLPVERTGEQPDQRLWDALFRPDAPLGPPPTLDARAYDSLRTPYSFGVLHAAATGLYAEAMATSPTAPLRRDHPVAQAIAALAELTDGGTGDAARRAAGLTPVPASARELLDPDRLTPERLDEAIAELTLAGRPEAARIAPFAPTVLRHRRRTSSAARAAATTPPPLAGVTSADKADVQQVLGLLLDHPALARRLGLVLDFTAAPPPVLTNQPPLRVDIAQGAPVRQVFDVVRTPPSRVRFDAQRRLFVMATRPNAVTEIRDGMLDIRPVGDSKYTVGDLDLESIARQLQLAGDQLAGGAGEIALPVRRDVGLKLAQEDRVDVAHAAVANAGLWQEPPEELEGEPVVYADDVTSGYRVDVSRNGRPFRSLMRRVAEYRLGDVNRRAPDLVVHDEGVVEPLVAVQQEDGLGGHALEIGEQVFGWDGCALGAPPPGPRVAPAAPAGANVVEPAASIAKGYDLAVRIAAEPGSLTPLRYGDTISLRARAVDLAGNSLAEDDTDSGFVTGPTKFVRHDPASAAVVVPARPFGGGETLTRIVARSDGDGRPLDGPAVRHLAPPPVAQRMAERHGMFDTAIGLGRPRAERERALAIGRMESGSFNDPVVRRPDGTTVAADGISVVAPPGTGPAATLPVPAGQALPAGQYVVHQTERLLVPHLPDPLVAGVALLPLPAEPGSTIDVAYGGEWPDLRPARLVVTAGTTFAMASRQAPGGPVIDVTLPPGEELDAAIASTIRQSRLGHVDPVPAHSVGHALHGLHIGLCQRQRVTLVHATRKPAADPVLTFEGLAPREEGSTVAGFSATATFHGPTTGKLDVVATWDEIIDTGIGDVLVEPRRLTLASVVPERGTSTMKLDVRHDFGDTKRRDLQVRLVAATRFRDCFPDLAEGDPLTLREGPAVPFTVTSTTVPTPLDVHSVVPTYRWERVVTPGRLTSRRKLAGVRIYVERPGAVTGVGEQLGVVTYVSQQVATSPSGNAVRNFVTRWGDDPLEERDAVPSAVPLVAAFPRGTGMFAGLQELLDVPGGAAFTTAVAAHELRFAADRGLWYADVDVKLDTNLPFFVRFGLVRVQPKSVVRCLVSPARTTDWIPLATPQSVTLIAKDNDEVFVRVGPVNHKNFVHRNRGYRAALQPRLLPAPPGASRNATPIDLTTTAGEVAVNLVLEPLTPPTDQAAPAPSDPFRFMIGTLRITTTDPAERARLRAGRIVVREDQVGSDLAKDQKSARPLWIETIDYAALRT